MVLILLMMIISWMMLSFSFEIVHFDVILFLVILVTITMIVLLILCLIDVILWLDDVLMMMRLLLLVWEEGYFVGSVWMGLTFDGGEGVGLEGVMGFGLYFLSFVDSVVVLYSIFVLLGLFPVADWAIMLESLSLLSLQPLFLPFSPINFSSINFLPMRPNTFRMLKNANKALKYQLWI